MRVNLPENDDNFRGMVIAAKDTVSQHDMFEAQVYVLKKGEGGRSKPITDRYIQPVFSSIWNMNGFVLLEKETPMIMPGDTSTVKLWLRKPMVLKKAQRFSMRENQFTSLTGVVTKLLHSEGAELEGFNIVPRSTTSNLTEAQITKMNRSKNKSK